jgi:hypothetical protein
MMNAMLTDATRLLFPASGATTLPLIFEPQVLRCTAAGPGGRPLTVLLDTGTDPSAVDLELARRLGLRLGEFALGQSAASDAVPFTETVLPWLRLGDLEVRDLFALAVDLRMAPFEIDVILGYNVLRQVILHVNYVQHMVSLRHPDLGLPLLSPYAHQLPLMFFEHFPALADLTLDEDLHLAMATIDTGSNSGLTVGPDLAAQLGLHRDATAVSAAQGHDFSGDCEVLLGMVERLQLGPFVLHQIALDTPANGGGDLRRAGRANIGNRLLARFATLTLDYERQICALEPPVQEKGSAEPRRRSM